MSHGGKNMQQAEYRQPQLHSYLDSSSKAVAMLSSSGTSFTKAHKAWLILSLKIPSLANITVTSLAESSSIIPVNLLSSCRSGLN
ncbi:hypothetical protein RRG08_006887 [Elysia crispata]|uniref:Uncharacterized protein n=1 Tax=Elysia crispata TaxID=231223 RepID=A0AAE0ZZD7_9GAST|nr:hypothetical protein RRG08_006887 [Elysia crispata]